MEIRINIIPPYRRDEIKQNERIKFVVRLLVLTMIIAAAFFGMLKNFNFALEMELDSASNYLRTDSEREVYSKILQYDKEFSNANTIISDVEKISKDQLYWSNFLTRLSEKTPSGVTVSKLETRNFYVSLSGVASDRDTLIGFKDKLAADPCFSKVDLPLSNLVSKTNIIFQMDLTLNDQCIKML